MSESSGTFPSVVSSYHGFPSNLLRKEDRVQRGAWYVWILWSAVTGLCLLASMFPWGEALLERIPRVAQIFIGVGPVLGLVIAFSMRHLYIRLDAHTLRRCRYFRLYRDGSVKRAAPGIYWLAGPSNMMTLTPGAIWRDGPFDVFIRFRDLDITEEHAEALLQWWDHRPRLFRHDGAVAQEYCARAERSGLPFSAKIPDLGTAAAYASAA